MEPDRRTWLFLYAECVCYCDTENEKRMNEQQQLIREYRMGGAREGGSEWSSSS